ncbi:MAG: hemolysin family protein [Planctomycetota bacterium]
MDDPYPIASLIAGLLVLGLAFLSHALEHFSKSKLLQILRDSPRRRRYEEVLIPNFERIESSIELFRMLCTIVFIASVEQSFRSLELAPVVTLTLTLLVAAIWLLPFCETLPRALTLQYHDGVARWALPIGYLLSFPLLPFRQINGFMRSLVFRLTGIDQRTSNEMEITEDIRSAVELGEREGVLEEDEKEMIENIIEFKDLDVSEVMTPRTDMFCLDIETPLEQAVREASQKGHSRIPVFRENRDQIIGVLYVKDLLRHWGRNGSSELKLSKMLRQPYFIPETKTIGELLHEFQRDKVHIAIVLDEYGGTSGLITIEDIVEEIVGEISDEYDPAAEEMLRVVEENRIANVDAKLHIDELNEVLGIEIPESEDFDTVGGFVFSNLGKVPQVGESLRHLNVEFRVLDADTRRINRLQVIVHPDEG